MERPSRYKWHPFRTETARHSALSFALLPRFFIRIKYLRHNVALTFDLIKLNGKSFENPFVEKARDDLKKCMEANYCCFKQRYKNKFLLTFCSFMNINNKWKFVYAENCYAIAI